MVAVELEVSPFSLFDELVYTVGILYWSKPMYVY